MAILQRILFLFLFCIACQSMAQGSGTLKSKAKTVQNVQINTALATDTSTIVLKQFDTKFKDKYKNANYIYEFKTPAKTAWDRFLDWLSDLIRSLFQFSTTGVAGSLIGIIFKIIMFGIIIFVIYLITKAILNKEGQWVFGKNSKSIIEYSNIEKNLHNTDFDKLIKNSEANGENRLVVRYYYLWLLKRLSDKGLIIWDIEKTNSDYLYELKNQSDKEQFEYLSYLYNYIWYGEFELDQETFVKAKTAFEKAIKKRVE
jgi:hypothetical protein